jgi:hypothetical protein
VTVRKNKRRKRSLAEVVESLPERFLHIDFQVDGQMNGWRSYITDLREYLSAEVGYRVDESVAVGVSAALGVSPAVWVGAALGVKPPAHECQYENRQW